MSQPSAKLPVFVPRLARTSERQATTLARRIMAPTRAVGARAASFADRVVGGWLGGTRESRAMPQVGAMPSARATRAAGSFVMPQPWYELPEDQVVFATPARTAPVVDAEAPVEAQPAPAPTVAERGAAIARPQIETPPEAAVRAEAARGESAHHQAAVEIARVENARAEIAQVEAARTEAVRTEAARTEASRTDATRTEVARTEAARTEAAHTEAARTEVARAEAAQTEAARTEVARTEAVRAEAVRTETARSEAVRTEVVRAEAQTEVARVEAARTEVARAEARTGAARTEAVRTEVARAETARTESVRTEVARVVEALRGEEQARAVDSARRDEAVRTDARARVEQVSAETTAAREAAAPSGAASPTAQADSATGAPRQATRELTAAEALGLTRTERVAAPRAEPVARPRSPLARALQHADWVDARLHGALESTRSTAGAGYVFVTPWTTEAPEAPARRFEAPPLVESVDAVRAQAESAGAVEPRVAATASPVEQRAAALTASSGLPELRLDAALAPSGLAGSRYTRFVEQLVGAQVARDVEALPVAFGPAGAAFAGEPAAQAIAEGPRRFERAPATVLLRLPETADADTGARYATESPAAASPAEISPAAATATSVAELAAAAVEARREITPEVLLPTARQSLRPGGTALRAEQLATAMDARAATAWGEPLPAPRTAAAERTLPAFAYVESPARPIAERPTIAAATAAERPATEATRPTVAMPTVEPRFAQEFQAAARASGPASIAQFIARLVGVDAARATTPLSIESAAAPSRAARAPARELLRAETTREPATEAARTAARAATTAAEIHRATATARPAEILATEARRAERPRTIETRPGAAADAVASRAPAMAMLRPGGIAVRAEQLAGAVGVRAASLSIDFVDPAGLPALTSGRASPELSYLWPRSSGETPVEHAPRAAQAAAGAAPAGLSFEEWALVATFPSSSTAIQVASARRAAQWSGAPSARAWSEAARPLLGAEPARAPSGIWRQAPATPALSAAERPLISSGGGARAAGGGATPGAARGAAMPAGGVESQPARRAAGAPSELVASPTVAAGDRAMLPGGRMPRGSFTWPRAASFNPQTSEFVPSRTQANVDGAAEAAPGTPLWGTLRPLVAMPGGRASESRGAQEPSALESALGFARPILELVRGSVNAEPSGSSSMAARFVEQSQSTPLVTGAPSSEAASRLVEAVQKPSATSTSDDRVTLGDLTLISMASATQQVAATATGGGPTAVSTVAHDAGGGGGAAHGGDHAAKPPSQSEVEGLARQVFDELQYQIDLSRERSGDPWES